MSTTAWPKRMRRPARQISPRKNNPARWGSTPKKRMRAIACARLFPRLFPTDDADAREPLEVRGDQRLRYRCIAAAEDVADVADGSAAIGKVHRLVQHQVGVAVEVRQRRQRGRVDLAGLE